MMKNFLEGMGSVLSIYPPERNIKIEIPTESDEEALKKDWEAIGNDMRYVIKEFNDGEK